MDENPDVVNAPAESVEPTASTPVEEKTVPYDRFEEVNSKMRDYEAKIQQYENYVASLSQSTPEPATSNDDGFIDPVAYKEQLKREMRQEQQFIEADRKDWELATKSYPELEDEDLSDAVRGYHQRAILKGKLISYKEAADKILGKQKEKENKAKEQGIEEATSSSRIQERAGISTPKAPTSSDDLIARYKRGQLTSEEIKKNWESIVAGMK